MQLFETNIKLPGTEVSVRIWSGNCKPVRDLLAKGKYLCMSFTKDTKGCVRLILILELDQFSNEILS